MSERTPSWDDLGEFERKAAERFRRLGMSESAAAIAARGRPLTETEERMRDRAVARESVAGQYEGQFVTVPDGKGGHRRLSVEQWMREGREKAAREAGRTSLSESAPSAGRVALRECECKATYNAAGTLRCPACTKPVSHSRALAE